MIILDIPQRSLDWHTSRLWRLTASKMKNVITSTGKLSKSEAAMGHIDKLIAGLDLTNRLRTNPEILDGKDDREMQLLIAHYTGEKFFGNIHTERGNDLEHLAFAALSERIGQSIDSVGMCIMGNDVNGVVSCSPDGLIYDAIGNLVSGAEVKCPCLSTYYGYVADGVLPAEYKLQVHAGMAICELESWQFGAFFEGKPLFHVEVQRDAFTDVLTKTLTEFRDVYADRYALVMDQLQKASA